MHFLIYKITNNINGKIYIGAHKTNDINDSYMGSGKHIKAAVKKYGRDSFTKEILHIFDNPHDMYLKETEIVNSEFIQRYDTYNCKVGGRGGQTGFMSEEEKNAFKEKMSKTQKERYASGEAVAWNKGGTVPDEIKKIISERLKGKLAGEKNPMYGKACFINMTDEEKKNWADKIKKSNTGKVRTEEHKKNYSAAAKARRWLVHRDGTMKTTMDPNDPRFDHPDWQRGKKWKD